MIRVLAKGNARAEVLIYDPIGADWFGDGVTAKKFRAELEALGNIDEIVVRINSPGGEVFDGFAIYNALRQHKANVTVYIDGLAASIASVIAMAGDQVLMGEGAMFMVHSPWTIALGDADSMRAVAEMLEKVEVGLVDAYVTKTGAPRATVQAWMAGSDTWFTREEAIAAGLADGVTPKSGDDADIDEQRAAAWTPAKIAAREAFRLFAATRNHQLSQRVTAETLQSAVADAPSGATTMNEEEIRAKALADDKARREAIKAKFGRFASDHADLLAQCLEDHKCNADHASDRLLAAMRDRPESAPLAGAARIEPGADTRDKFLAGAALALSVRAGLQPRDATVAGNEFMGQSLADLAAKALTLAGHSIRGLSRDGIARRVLAVHTTSDFPALLSNTAGKVLRNAYGSFPNTWQQWALAGEVSDFKIHPRIQIGSFNNLATIPEGGEYTYGSLDEEYENAQAVTKGKAIALTRQMIVNDDLGGFNRRAQLMGRAAARSVNVDAYTLLTSGSANHGPTSNDTGQYFNATATTTAGGHANLTDTGTAISTASIALGRKTMRVQKDQSNRETLNILPKVLLCSALKEDIAWAVLNSTSEISQSNPGKKNYAADVAKLSLVTDPFLDGIGSGLPWYMFADPMDIAAFEVVFLDGNQTPFVDETIDFDTDAMKFKVRLDYGVALGDWRAGYLNDGA
jgi:ATP-dependent protease ClpP protease subunit